MPKVICTLPNASELISGVRFVSHKLGMISEEIEEDVAANFALIEGYLLSDKKGKPVDPPDEPKPPAAPPKDPPADLPEGSETNPPADPSAGGS